MQNKGIYGAQLQITDRDLRGHLSKYQETSNLEFVCVNPDEGIFVTFGVPLGQITPDLTSIIVPNDPHVFMVHELYIQDRCHINLRLDNVTVMLGHGHKDDLGIWRFSNGQSLIETIEDTDQYIKDNYPDAPTIEFLIVCNNLPHLERTYPDHPELHDMNTIMAINHSIIARSIDQKVDISHGNGDATHYDDGSVVMRVSLEDGEFYMLDELIRYRNSST